MRHEGAFLLDLVVKSGLKAPSHFPPRAPGTRTHKLTETPGIQGSSGTSDHWRLEPRSGGLRLFRRAGLGIAIQSEHEVLVVVDDRETTVGGVVYLCPDEEQAWIRGIVVGENCQGTGLVL